MLVSVEWLMVRWSVTALSQPTALGVYWAMVSVSVVEKVVPCHVKWSQAVARVSPWLVERRVKWRVTALSQPTALVVYWAMVSVSVVEKVVPCHRYEWHEEARVSPWLVASTTRRSVRILSQPWLERKLWG